MNENIENSKETEKSEDLHREEDTKKQTLADKKPRKRKALSFELLESTVLEDIVESKDNEDTGTSSPDGSQPLPEEFILPSRVFYDDEPLPEPSTVEDGEMLSPIENESDEPTTATVDEPTEEHTVFMVEDEPPSDVKTPEASNDENTDSAGHTYLPDAEFENEQFDFGDEEVEEPKAEDDTVKGDEDKHGFVKYDPNTPRRTDTWFDLVEIFTFTLVAIIFISSFFFRHSIVDGDSMLGTLENGDHLIITDVFYTPKQGDIIVFEDYSTGYKKPLIKRVIATEGQTVQINFNGEVFVDGEKLDEQEYVYENELHGIDYFPLYYVVPEGEVFVMGDHRCCSTDSRYFGSIKTETILGKVILQVYPFAKFGPVN